MGLGCNKALLPLGGKTVLERSVEAFEGMVDGIVAVCRRQDEERVRALGINGKIVTGGPSRQESVLNGLRVLPQSAQVVLVHDAARPLSAGKRLSAALHPHRNLAAASPRFPLRIRSSGQTRMASLKKRFPARCSLLHRRRKHSAPKS